jgi:hypothetical protein
MLTNDRDNLRFKIAGVFSDGFNRKQARKYDWTDRILRHLPVLQLQVSTSNSPRQHPLHNRSQAIEEKFDRNRHHDQAHQAKRNFVAAGTSA